MLHEVIGEICREYGLRDGEIKIIVTEAVRRSLMDFFHLDSEVYINSKGIEGYIFRGEKAVRVDFSKISKGFVQIVRKHLKNLLRSEILLSELKRISGLQGKLAIGWIEYKTQNFTVVSLKDGIKGILLKAHQPKKERNTYKIGESMFFWSLSTGTFPLEKENEVVLFLSRTSINLPSAVIMRSAEENGIKTTCRTRKRVPGVFSIVSTNIYIPKHICRYAEKQLNESIRLIRAGSKPAAESGVTTGF